MLFSCSKPYGKTLFVLPLLGDNDINPDESGFEGELARHRQRRRDLRRAVRRAGAGHRSGGHRVRVELAPERRCG